MNIQNRTMHTKGMTFIEISIALLIIGAFLAFVLPRLTTALLDTYKNNTKMSLGGLKTRIMQYHTDTHQYPNTLSDLTSMPADRSIRWKGPYGTEDDQYDGWGARFEYRRNPAGSGKRPFELYSWGANGEGASQEEWVDVWNI